MMECVGRPGINTSHASHLDKNVHDLQLRFCSNRPRKSKYSRL